VAIVFFLVQNFLLAIIVEVPPLLSLSLSLFLSLFSLSISLSLYFLSLEQRWNTLKDFKVFYLRVAALAALCLPISLDSGWVPLTDSTRVILEILGGID